MSKQNSKQGYSKKNSKPTKTTGTRSKKQFRGKRESEERVEGRTSDVVNDYTYYIPSEGTELMSQLTNFSFPEFQGVPAEVGTIGSTAVQYRVGNIMQVALNPSMPMTSGSRSDGINMAALKLYTYLSSQNAKATNYAPQDVAMLLLAIGSILENFSWGARGLGMVKTYNVRNRSYPRLAVAACGFDLDDIKANYAQNCAMYNYLIAKFNKIALPANIKYFQKCAELYHGIYLDEDGSSMAQTYAFVPYTFWTFDEAYSQSGSGLKTTAPVGYTNSPFTQFRYCPTFGSYLVHLEAQIDALLNSTTFNYIYADILRCNEKNGLSLLKLNELPINYGVLPSKVDELSEWLNNLVVVGEPRPAGSLESTSWTPSNDVVGDANTNTITYRPQFTTLNDLTGYEFLLNWKYENPDMAAKINATRLHAAFKCMTSTVVQNRYATTDVALSDHYVVRTAVCSDDSSSARKDYINMPMYLLTSGTSAAGVMLPNDLWSKFDWAPYIYYHDASANELYVLGDLQYYTTLPYDVLNSINDVAMMSLLELK